MSSKIEAVQTQIKDIRESPDPKQTESSSAKTKDYSSEKKKNNIELTKKKTEFITEINKLLKLIK